MLKPETTGLASPAADNNAAPAWVLDTTSLGELAGTSIIFPSEMSTRNVRGAISDLREIALHIELLYYGRMGLLRSGTSKPTITSRANGRRKTSKPKSRSTKTKRVLL